MYVSTKIIDGVSEMIVWNVNEKGNPDDKMFIMDGNYKIE